MNLAGEPKTTADTSPAGSRAWRLLGGALGPLMALILVVAFFGVADYVHNGSSTFLSLITGRMIAVQTCTVAIAGLGMTLIIIAGGIDLSAGTAMAMAATVLAWCLRADHSVGVSIVAAIGSGVLAGLLNGVLISGLRVVPFIITLGTMTIFLGASKLIADETTVRPLPHQVPGWLPDLVAVNPQPEWLLVSTGVWIALALAGSLAIVLRYTVFGRHVFALGSNESTARLCGVNVPLTKIAVYALAGLFVGIAGVYQFAYLASGNPTSGRGQELKFIAAVVIGGASLNGGQGSVIGTLAGALMMGVIEMGCQTLDISSSVQDIVIGLIIIAAVAIDQVRQRRLAA